jgi:glutaredoxin
MPLSVTWLRTGLRRKGIPYTDYNVAADMDKRKEMVEITGQLGVPVIKIENDVMVGFNQDQAWRELLGVPAVIKVLRSTK